MSLSWRTYLANEPRFVGTDRALLFGPGGTNLVNNPTGQGATLGTPGALPPGWSITGMTLISVGPQGVFNGVPWTEYEFDQPLTGGRIQFAAPSLTDTLAYIGQLFVGYPVPPVGITASRMRLTNTVTNLVDVTPPTDGTLGRVSASWVANATGAAVHQLQFASSGAATFRIRIGWNDFKQQAFLTNPILASSGPAAIGLDRLSEALAGLNIGPGGVCTIWQDVEFLSPVAPSGGNEVLFYLDDNSNSNRFGLDRQTGSGALLLRRSLASSNVTASCGTPTVGVRTGVAMTIRGDGTARAVLHGNAGVEVSGGPTSGLLSVRWNSTFAGANPSHFRTRRIAWLPFSVSNAQLDNYAADAAVWS